MHIVDRVSWIALLLFGGFVVYESLQISYYGSDFGPGPGFFSFWLGILVAVLAVVEISKTFRRQAPLPTGFLPGRDGVLRITYLLTALFASVLLLERLGYALTMLCFCVFLLRLIARTPWWLTLVLAGVGSFGTAYVFRQLQVILPGGILGI